ncbi:MAG: gamma-glutamyl-gamma-aminobutyrate hydrolase family protein [Acidobacteriota bacterium]|nr:MAG: gamma-glutamyl-gamma-aminobutyrate hydrolase family protein [Acidobacteriota bacterium]
MGIEPGNETWSDRYCLYEVITPRIEYMRVILVDNLIADESQFSEIAKREPGYHAGKWVRLERMIASMAMANIENNVRMLVRRPDVRLIHLSDLNDEVVREFDPDAILLSGTYRDFDIYAPSLIESFNHFIHRNRVPVLAICGGHQLVGQAYGARILTLDDRLPSEKREGRMLEYQYRFVKITDISDPIFAGIQDRPMARWQRYTKRRHLLRVWQNHGLQLDRLPDGFRHLARGYLSEIQMMVRRTPDQLIYGVQFHIEKSFQDWQADKYWEHRNESRDGRLIFDNFLIEALRFRGREENLVNDSGPKPVTGGFSTGSSSSVIPATGF